MDKETMIKHCQEKADELWQIHATMDVNDTNYLRIEGRAQAYDEMAGFLINGY